MSLRGAKRRGNPHPLRWGMTESSTLGEYAATTNLPEVVPSCQVSLRGKRIAAPVCALVRNDMQKEGRVRGCKDVSPLSLRGAKRRGNPHPLRWGMTESSTLGEYAATTNLPWYHVVAYADTRQVFTCHCEERSDVAIRIPCGSTKQRAAPKANTGKCHGFA